MENDNDVTQAFNRCLMRAENELGCELDYKERMVLLDTLKEGMDVASAGFKEALKVKEVKVCQK